MKKIGKKEIYIFLFVFLGIELQFLAYFLIEAGHIALMNRDFLTYGIGKPLSWWLAAYGAGAFIFFFLGAFFGFFQGKYWWEAVYGEKKQNFRRSFLKKISLFFKKNFRGISKNYLEIKNFKCGSVKIDKIYIGPTGIFTIEIKENMGILAYYDGHLLVEGRMMKDDFIGEARKEAAFLSDFIFQKFGKKYFVVPMVVFPNADVDDSMNFRKDDVWIGDKGFQDYVIKRSNYSISKEEILKIADFLREEKAKGKGSMVDKIVKI